MFPESHFEEPKCPSPRGEGSVVRRTVNDRTQNFDRERSERHSDADYIFLYNKVMASLAPLALSEGNLIASQSDAWSGGMEAKKLNRKLLNLFSARVTNTKPPRPSLGARRLAVLNHSQPFTSLL